MVRAAEGDSRITSARITLFTDCPSTAIRPSARMIGGKPISTSTTRWVITSLRPPKYAEVMPHNAPRVTPTPTEVSPTYSESRAPHTTRLKMSRPRWSVPKGCSPPGGR